MPSRPPGRLRTSPDNPANTDIAGSNGEPARPHRTESLAQPRQDPVPPEPPGPFHVTPIASGPWTHVAMTSTAPPPGVPDSRFPATIRSSFTRRRRPIRSSLPSTRHQASPGRTASVAPAWRALRDAVPRVRIATSSSGFTKGSNCFVRSAPSAGRSRSVSFSMAIDTPFAGVCSPRAPDPLLCRNPRAASLRPCTHRAGSSAADAPESDDRDIDQRFRHGQWLSWYPMCRFPPSISVDCFHKWR